LKGIKPFFLPSILLIGISLHELKQLILSDFVDLLGFLFGQLHGVIALLLLAH
jgi:hypothetical protein